MYKLLPTGSEERGVLWPSYFLLCVSYINITVKYNNEMYTLAWMYIILRFSLI